MSGSRSSSLVLALALFGMAIGCGWLVFRPSMPPKRYGAKRNLLAEWLWDHARSLYVVIEKAFLVFGGLGCLAGSIYCVKLAGSGG